MIKTRLQAAAEKKVLRAIVAFFDSYAFPAVYAVAVFISSLFGLEIAFYALSVACCIFCSLFSKDSKPFLGIFIMLVYSTSWKHTPQPPYSSDFLNTLGVQVYMGIAGGIVVATFIFRMAVYGNGKNFFKDSHMRLGIILMCAALVLNGAFYSGYTFADLALGLLIALSFFAAYIYFFHTLDINEKTAQYVAYILVLAGGIVFLQIVKVYLCDGVIVDGSVVKDLIKMGWGMSNNAGGMLAIFFPACFYLAIKAKKGGFAFYVLGFVYFGGVCLTFSRTSVLVGGVVLLCAFVYFCIKKTSFRKFVWIFNGAIVICGIGVTAIFWSKITEIFAEYFERGFSDMGRFDIWLAGIENFLKSPIFGAGFYEPILINGSAAYDIENWVFPDMYHNLFIQMLASCGIVGLIAIIVHLVQILMCVNRKFTTETLFYIVIPLVILGVSLLDNHIFHVFPALVYSIFLLLIERDGERSPLWRSRGILRGQSPRKKRKDK